MSITNPQPITNERFQEDKILEDMQNNVKEHQNFWEKPKEQNKTQKNDWSLNNSRIEEDNNIKEQVRTLNPFIDLESIEKTSGSLEDEENVRREIPSKIGK